MKRCAIVMKTLIGFCGIVILLVAGNASAALVNVAASSNGGFISAFSETFNGASLDTLIDETFVPRGTNWQSGTVWWQNEEDYYVEISFNTSYIVKELIVQADDNDSYSLQSWNNANSTWDTLWDIPNYDSYGNGMQTRPNPADDSERYVLPTSIVTDRMRVKAASGDNMYSLSEVQAYGLPVPLPGAAWLFASGLLSLIGFSKLGSTLGRS